ncbi:hypothetical protein SAMN05421856_1104 [Chryseobacterium taichungense]|uniref:Uncharacterized protein n=1 Tax=Chryseobacterium taichungense TaxID=295069 RepID=A0A1H8CMA1_9FLAO|nr:hypothetical protein SAMN05421856_1104 [Chryseobacterium taichungense]
MARLLALKMQFKSQKPLFFLTGNFGIMMYQYIRNLFTS